MFPDTVSTLGTRHLRELIGTLGHGGHVPLRAVLCFCVQRCDVREVRPADDIDPDYGRTLREALEAGVEAIAYRAELSPEAVVIAERIPVVCS